LPNSAGDPASTSPPTSASPGVSESCIDVLVELIDPRRLDLLVRFGMPA
jgi:hypothetical protein